MKKVLAITIMTLLTFLVTGCNNITAEETAMKEYSQQYYEQYIKGNFIVDELNITVGQIKDASNRLNASFDLSKISSCTDDSFVTLKLNSETNEIVDYIYKLNCN